MFSLEHLSINIAGKMLFSNLSVSFLGYSITYLQGPNGCGKTSLLRILALLTEPTSGKIIYQQKPVINYIGHNLGLKAELTVNEHLKFWMAMRNSFAAFEAAIHYFDLTSLLDKKIYELSAGNQKKVALAKLLLLQANLWLLDEADSNLDFANKQLLNNLIVSKANNGGTIILTSHESQTIDRANFLTLTDFI